MFIGAAAHSTSSLFFSGHSLVKAVLHDVQAELEQSERIIVAGAGHGGIGAMSHLDWIQVKSRLAAQ
jgi:hypothetical protein